ncbi:MAG: S1 RNA-binding domain-containing protein [Candidatus Amesbacteria bacterium]|nr:S1 RNA-binding domain-containing protein [Candidatus Amesbacteria bacterium]
MKKATKSPSKPTSPKVSLGSSPLTMAQLLASTGHKISTHKRGDVVKGIITAISGHMMFVDVGGKTEGILGDREFDMAKEYLESLKVGDEVTGVVISQENDSGQIILSLKRAADDSRWKNFEEAHANGTNITVKGREVNKSGLLVDAEGLVGFIPSSQFSHELSESPQALIGKPIKVQVIEVDREQNRLVLSEKAVTESIEIEARKKLLKLVKIGTNYAGIVTGIVPFGAFVQVKVGKGAKAVELEGLVHISEISWEKVDDVHTQLTEGQAVEVQVIGIDESTGKLALSLKKLSDDPWINIVKDYPVDSKHKGKVVKVAPFGVFVNIRAGIEGLIHASKMSGEGGFKIGEEVNVFIESIDTDKRRLSLGVVLTAKPVDYK